MKIVKVILLLCMAIPVVSCYQTERNCSQFKTGTFRFEAMVGTQLETTTFVRNDTMEIDFFRGKSDTSSIRWINDCEYIVRKINPKNMHEQKAVHMKILSTRGNTYTFEYSLVGETQKQKGTATKVN